MLTLQCIYISIKYILIIPTDYCNKYMNTQTEIHRSIQLLTDLYICIAYKKIFKKPFSQFSDYLIVRIFVNILKKNNFVLLNST